MSESDEILSDSVTESNKSDKIRPDLYHYSIGILGPTYCKFSYIINPWINDNNAEKFKSSLLILFIYRVSNKKFKKKNLLLKK